jgi:titin
MDCSVTHTGDGGAGSLRQCILNSNTNPGPDVIEFNIGGTVQTIQPLTPLPLVTGQTTIDGFTANGSGPGTPLIELNGSFGSALDGLVFTSANNIVRGLIINGFVGNGLVFFTGGNNLIEGNFIGTNANGTDSFTNGLAGILIQSGSNNNTIGGTVAAAANLISGNTTKGISITTNNNIIKGNFIGTDETGTLPMLSGSNGVGISISGGSGNIIGGTVDAERNLISGNSADGIEILSGLNNVIQGNYIGTDKTGTVALSNGGNGITLSFGSNNNTIGGTVLSGTLNVSGNLLSGNLTNGLAISGNNNNVQGNRIGTDETGAFALPDGNGDPMGNGQHGIAISGGSSNTIGGTSNRFRNLISGNTGDGIHISGNSNLVRGNYIGTILNGVAALGNKGNGVTLFSSATNNDIGGTIITGTANVSANVISANEGDGVVLEGSGVANNNVRGNWIGTDRTGTVALGNLGNGVTVSEGANNNTIGGTVMVGLIHAARNIIAGNGEIGVHILNQAATTKNKVEGNYIGTDRDGTAALANDRGAAISGGAVENTIGGTIVEARNLISGNTNYGVGIFDRFTSKNVVHGNYIGTDVTGLLALGNGEGVNIFSAASENTIGGTIPRTQGVDMENVSRNIISGNIRQGVRIYDTDTSLNLVQGNYIGTDVTGTVALANTYGVEIEGGATNNLIGGTIIAGAIIDGKKQAASLNVISGNSEYGVGLLDSRTALNVVEGNWIGVDVTGSVALANKTGVEIFNRANGNIIGGTTLDEDSGDNLSLNVIAGNTGDGVAIWGPGTNSNVVLGNYIGLLADGVTDLANNGNGVHIYFQAARNVIGGVGGTVGAAGNYIARNGLATCTVNCPDGIRIESGASLNVVKGNYIGLNTNGNAMPNKRHGVAITTRRQDVQRAERNVVGGIAAGEGNTIVANTLDGVYVELGRRNAIRGNSIYGHNAGLGIRLWAFANLNQVAPTITNVVLIPPSTIRFFFTITASPNTQYGIDFFTNLACHPSGFGEGQFYLGSFDVTTDGAGVGSGMATFGTYDIPTMNPIATATATDPTGNSSQFSPCFNFTEPPAPGTHRPDPTALAVSAIAPGASPAPDFFREVATPATARLLRSAAANEPQTEKSSQPPSRAGAILRLAENASAESLPADPWDLTLDLTTF